MVGGRGTRRIGSILFGGVEDGVLYLWSVSLLTLAHPGCDVGLTRALSPQIYALIHLVATES